jgi:hypothetical protein
MCGCIVLLLKYFLYFLLKRNITLSLKAKESLGKSECPPDYFLFLPQKGK